ncbi:MAG: hypothetical protein AAFW81_10340 [Pseudomonadota bacterium]
MDTRLSRLKATFASPETEAAYQAFISEDDRKSNLRVLIFALPIYAAYIVLDVFSLEQPQTAIAIRLGAFALCYSLLVCFRPTIAGRQHEWLTLVIALIVAHAVNIIIYRYTDLQDAYYVGLVQGCVFVCFLLRMSFLKSAATIVSFFAGFVLAISGKAGAGEAASIQTVTLGSMVGVCTIGAYLLQRFRRFDFQKVLIIEEQNAQLSTLLERAEEDNERKIAALNLLVHFVKTPLHQISGFSDILVQSATSENPDGASENAQYIKQATSNLTKSVNGLLVYHRLDEAEANAAPEPTRLSVIAGDFEELLPEKIAFKKGKIGDAAVLVDPALLRTALAAFVEHYKEEAGDASEVTLSADRVDGAPALVFRDDARILSAAQFEEMTKPLTEITEYLGHTGSEMAMALRTLARAVSIIGGSIDHAPLADGNRFVITFPEAQARKVAA